MQRVRETLEHSDVNVISPSNPSHHGSGTPTEEKCKRCGEGHQETRPAVSTWSMHIKNSQRLRWHAQGLHKFAPVGVLELKGEIDTLLTQKPSLIDNHLQTKIQFLPRESHSETNYS